MAILHIAVHLGGGAGKAIVGISGAGDTIVLLEEPKRIYWFHKAKQKGIRVIVVPGAAELEDLIRESDIIVINWWGHPLMIRFVTGLADIYCRLALYCHVNGCVYPYLPFSFLNEFDAILFTTPFSYENPLWTSHEKKIIQDKSTVVYGMGDFEPEQLSPRDSYKKKNPFEVGYIGTINYAKLNPEFVRYCEAAADQIENIKFVLAGDIADDVRRDIEKSRISGKFEYVGYVDHVEEFYKRIDVLGYLLNGYNFATTENVLLEAMAYATPIVALDQGVERHIIKDGHNGCLVNSFKEYADIMFSLFLSEKWRKSLGETARRSCIEKYSNTENRAVYENALCKCLNMPKKLHSMNCLLGRSPFEWLLFFSQKDQNVFCEDVFIQGSKGSIFQYLKYFQKDINLKRICALEENRKGQQNESSI